jgi:hypothetical protein
VALPGECEVLVVSDKSEVLEMFSFSLRSGGMGEARVLRPSPEQGVVQLEAAARTLDGEGVLILTSGTFKGAPHIEQSREDHAVIVARDEEGVWYVREDLTRSWRGFLSRVRRQVGGWLKVEALDVLDDRFLVGIRQFGDAFNRFDYGLRVVVWDPSEPSVTSLMSDPRSVTVEEQGDMLGTGDTYMRTYGVSSLECDPGPVPGRMQCYMLATSEAGLGIHDVKSRLFSFDLEELWSATSFPGREVACFWGKAEGITILDNGLALVIFDSDRDRKGGASSTELFRLEDNQDFYWIGEVRHPDPAFDDGDPPPTCIGPTTSVTAPDGSEP